MRERQGDPQIRSDHMKHGSESLRFQGVWEVVGKNRGYLVTGRVDGVDHGY